MATEYYTECGSLPLSFIQMLASIIFGYDDIAGVRHFRLNTLEQTGGCVDLRDVADCDIQSREPDRLLVENVFSTDTCGNLAIKDFINQDSWTDFDDCDEPLHTFIEMLSRCIYGYSDVQENFLINTVQETNHCDDLEDLVDCDVNNIESERLLVSNAFAVDACGNLALKIFVNVGAGDQRDTVVADYNTECIDMPQSLLQLLARCLVLYNGHYMINVLEVTDLCSELHAFWTCSNNHIDPERALVENIFATDECGHLALKTFVNQEEGS